MADFENAPPELLDALEEIVSELEPLEGNSLFVLVDNRTNARYFECHIKGSKLVALATTDVPLDPEEQPEYRANREIVENAHAFEIMKDDATKRRSFSNLVTEYTKEYDESHPLKVIGGQHRFAAIREALVSGVDEYHGLKIYLALDTDQRLDVQLISNTNIAISGDLFDRMQETVQGPQLRDWCQTTGLLPKGEDFADRRLRGGPISVQAARTFISNYFRGKSIDPVKFDKTDTTPSLCPTGERDADWDVLKKSHPNLWKDSKLIEAGTEFAALIAAQRAAFAGKKPRPKPDYPVKAMNPAILSAWAFVAGALHNNPTRLKRHFALRSVAGKDPLNAAELAKGRHKTDPENYRGLGYRTEPRERGRFVELFYLQAEKGMGISKALIDLAIKVYHAKQAQLEVIKATGEE